MQKAKYINRICLLLLSIIAFGCGPGVGEGPAPTADSNVVLAGESGASDAGIDAKADETTDAVIEVINNPWSDIYRCQSSTLAVNTILQSDSFGEDFRFVTMGQNTILAEESHSDITEPILIFMDDDEYLQGQAKLAEPPSSSLRSIGVVNRREAPYGEDWPFPYYAIVLLSGADGNALLGANIDPQSNQNPLLLIDNSMLPADVELRGLIYLKDKIIEVEESIRREPQFHRLCAFGDGIFCFTYDGSTWDMITLLDAGSGAVFNSIAVTQADQEWFLLAVGDQGRIARISMDGSQDLQEISSGTDRTLQTATARGERLAIAGESGVLILFDDLAQQPSIHNISEETIVSLKFRSVDDLRGITESGNFFQIPFNGTEACFFNSNISSALYGRLDGADGDFLVVNGRYFLRGHAEQEPLVII